MTMFPCIRKSIKIFCSNMTEQKILDRNESLAKWCHRDFRALDVNSVLAAEGETIIILTKLVFKLLLPSNFSLLFSRMKRSYLRIFSQAPSIFLFYINKNIFEKKANMVQDYLPSEHYYPKEMNKTSFQSVLIYSANYLWTFDTIKFYK